MAIARWREWCAVPDCRVVGSEIEVNIGGGRTHRITVQEDGAALRLTGEVAGQRVLRRDGLEIDIWQRNRRMMLAGFRFAANDRLVGESWVPTAGLDADEFLLHVRTLARECERLEYQLYGEDVV